MKKFIASFLLLPLLAAGCVSKADCDARAKAAFLAGQQHGMAMQANASSVWLVGNVKTPVIPWTVDLTLAKALIAAEYQGANDPTQFTILRNGRPPQIVTAKQLLSGFDVPLQIGDRIEIR
jgi:hypothetical protein